MRKSVRQKEHLWEIIRLKASLAAFVGDHVTRPGRAGYIARHQR